MRHGRNAVCAILTAFLGAAAPAEEFQIHVTGGSPEASDNPAPSVNRQIAAALQNLPTNQPGHIILGEGIHELTEPLILSLANRTANDPLIIEAAPGTHPVLSGGVEIIGWQKLNGTVPGLPEAAKSAVWVADVPKIDGRTLGFRELWVDDKKAHRANPVRAREPNGEGMDRIAAWDKTNQVATIPVAALAGIRQPEGLEMVVDQVWEIAVLRVKSIRVEGTNALLTFREPESGLEFQHPWPPIIVKTNYHAPFFLANAIQFLDSPGEWFEDVPAGKIYYWPLESEDMAHAEVFAPVLETLVKVEGTRDQPAANIEFRGITFSHTTWMRPSEQGHVPLQAGMYMLDAHKLSPKGTPYHRGLDNVAWIGRPPAAVEVENAAHISFEHCTFEHLASAGLDFVEGTHDDLVDACSFQDIGGNGIQLGKFSDTNVETHVPYLPADEREICARETINNNLISNCGEEDWGCVGIAAGYVRDVKIEHNDVFNLPYTGISVGWGWTKATNCMRNNLIHANHVQGVAKRLGDTAGIYILSAQPGTVVSENRVEDIVMSPYVPDPDHWFYLYLDEGSSYITVRDNWCPAEKFLKNANGPGNIWDNNGPQVSDLIKNSAGRIVFRTPTTK